MRIINMGRGTGKTYRLVVTADTIGIPIIVFNMTRKRHVEDVANCYGFKNVRVYTIDEYKKLCGNGEREIMIDDYEDIAKVAVSEYLGHPEILAATMCVKVE